MHDDTKDLLALAAAVLLLLLTVGGLLLAIGFSLAWLFGPAVLYVLAIAIGLAGIYTGAIELRDARRRKK